MEDVIDEIIVSHLDLDLHYWNETFKLAEGIHDYQSSASFFWESERVVDIVHGFLEKWERDGLREPELLERLAHFCADK